MIEIEIDDKIIKVETALTIDKFQKINANPEKYKTVGQIIALYLDLTEKDVKNLPVEKIKILETAIYQHLNQEHENQLMYSFTFEGKHYGLENDWANLTWGQWVDMEIFSAPDKVNNSIHVLMALLYREIEIKDGQKYTLEKYDESKVLERAELFKNLPIQYWYASSNFFFQVAKLYIISIESSLKQKIKLQKKWMNKMKWLPSKWLHKILPDFTSI